MLNDHTNSKLFNYSKPLSNFETDINNDLNIEEVFAKINKTQSAYGAQFLYNYLFTTNYFIDTGMIEEDQRKIENLRTPKLDNLLQKANTYRDSHVIDLLHAKLELPKWIKILAIVPLLLYAIGFVGILQNNLLILSIPAALCCNTIIYIWSKRELLYHMFGLSALRKFIKIAKHIHQIKSDLKGIKSDSAPNLSISIALFFQDLNNSAGKEPITGTIIETLKLITNIEFYSYWYCISKIQDNNKLLLDQYNYIGYIDMLLSLSSIEECYNTCKPQFTDKSKIDLKDAYHPLIENCVTNSIYSEDGRVLITGANMSGKTIFLKQLAINIYLAQKLNLCFATHAIVPKVPVYSYISISDSLAEGESYYSSELNRIKHIIASCKKKPGLVIIDEIFKGTNRNEQVAMGCSVLKHLSKTAANTFASTHDIELVNLLNDFENYYFEMKYDSNNYFFDYKIQKGNLLPKNAIKLAEILKLDKEIVSDANKLYTELSMQ